MSRTIRKEPVCSCEVFNKTFNSDVRIKKEFKREAHRAVRRVSVETELPSGSTYKRLTDPWGWSDRIEPASHRHAG